MRSKSASTPPKQLRFEIGGCFSLSLTLHWDGVTLRRFRTLGMGRFPAPEEWEVLAPPSQAAWARLAQALESAKAWQWPRSSDDPDMLDGTQWELSLAWGARKWAGRGSNAYPEGFEAVREALVGLSAALGGEGNGCARADLD